MAVSKYLAIYLNDHLAGSTAGLELARRAASQNEGSELGAFLSTLASDIEADKHTLEDIMATFDVPHDRVKTAFAWAGEKAGRLKMNGQVRGYSPLSLVVELEMLSLGIEGKRSLWRSLRQIVDADERLSPAKLDEMIERAESQRAEVEQHRIEAARKALTLE